MAMLSGLDLLCCFSARPDIMGQFSVVLRRPWEALLLICCSLPKENDIGPKENEGNSVNFFLFHLVSHSCTSVRKGCFSVGLQKGFQY